MFTPIQVLYTRKHLLPCLGELRRGETICKCRRAKITRAENSPVYSTSCSIQKRPLVFAHKHFQKQVLKEKKVFNILGISIIITRLRKKKNGFRLI